MKVDIKVDMEGYMEGDIKVEIEGNIIKGDIEW